MSVFCAGRRIRKWQTRAHGLTGLPGVRSSIGFRCEQHAACTRRRTRPRMWFNNAAACSARAASISRATSTSVTPTQWRMPSWPDGRRRRCSIRSLVIAVTTRPSGAANARDRGCSRGHGGGAAWDVGAHVRRSLDASREDRPRASAQGRVPARAADTGRQQSIGAGSVGGGR